MASTCSSSFTAPANLKSSIPHSFPLPAVLSFPLRSSRTGGGGMRAVVVAMAGEEEKRMGRRKYMGTYVRERRLEELIERKVEEAKEACEGDARSDGCKVAWDEVEEVSQAKADLRRRIIESDADPLEGFCRDNPHTDECRVHED